MDDTMALPKVVSRPEWLAARLELLEREKEVMRAQDGLAARRRELGMVRVDKEYTFEGPDGPVTLADAFEGRPQLVVYHFMFQPDWDEACPSCTFAVDNIGRLDHLHEMRTTFALVSRAPWPKLAGWRDRMGWTVPWYSSAGTDFNYDFHVTNDPARAPVEYNYLDEEALERRGFGYAAHGDAQGLSVFVRDGDDVYHSYSTYGRGGEVLLSTYHYLDLTPLGRQDRYVNQFPYHDTYR